jgi:Tol biopolymer transport system component
VLNPHVPVRVLVIAGLILALIAAALVGVGTFREPRPVLGGGGWITVSLNGDVIHVLAPDGSVDRATPKRAGQFCSHLSPTGDRVAYSVRFQGMFVESLDGTGRQGIAGFSNFGWMDGIWSPDRSRLAFRTNEANGLWQELKVLSIIDGSVTTVFKTNLDDLLSEGAWSPDSQRVAVAHGRGGEGTIEVIGRDGAIQSTLGAPPMADSVTLAWSPDGSRLAAITQTGAPASVVVIDLATGTRDEVLTGDVHADPGEQVWSPDGKWLAVQEGGGNLLLARADGTDRRLVPVGPLLDGWRAEWSPARNEVAISDGDAVRVIGLDGTERVLDKLAARAPTWNLDWSPDGSRIVVAELDDASGAIRVTTRDAAGGETPVVVAAYQGLGNAPVPPSALPGICLSWDSPPAQP